MDGFQSAAALHLAGRHEAAVAALRAWLAQAPSDDRRRAAALTLLARGLEDEAVLAEAIDLARRHGWEAEELDALLARAVQDDAAWAEAAERALELGDATRHACCLALRAHTLAWRGEAEEATVLLARAEPVLRQAPPSESVARAWRHAGVTHAFAHQLDPAQEALERALAAGEASGSVPATAMALGYLGMVQLTRGRPEEALALHQRAVALAETTDDVRMLGLEQHRLSNALKALGRLDEADEMRERAVANASNDWDAVRRGNDLVGEGRYVEALHELERVRGSQSVVEACRLLGCLPGLAVEGRAADWDDVLAAVATLAPVCPPEAYMALLAEVGARVIEEHRPGDPRWLGRAMRLLHVAAHACRRSGRVDVLEATHRELARLRSLGAMAPVGPFLLDQPLGSGAVGQVWRAEGPGGVPVAVKVLAPGSDPRHADLLEDEIAATAALDHPNIVRILDHGRIDAETAAGLPGAVEGAPWLALELATLGTLEPWCGITPWERLLPVLLALLDALAHAHARGVLHLDLKPANVLLSGSAAAPVAKLGDLGLSRLHVRTGRIAGTPAFAAPEQLQGRTRDFGPWTDLYAFGCVVTMLVQGTPPFDLPSAQALREAHARHPVPPLAPRVPVPAGLESWLARALAKAPEDRFRRAADAARALLELGPPRGARSDGDAAARVPTSELPTIVLPAWERRPGDALPPEGACVVPKPEVPMRWQPARAVATPPELVHAGLGLFGLRAVPMVGRRAERSLAWACLREVATTGRARALVIHGPPGTGASRLAAWIAERAHEVGAAHVLAGSSLADLIVSHYRLGGLDGTGRLARLGEHVRAGEEAEALADTCAGLVDEPTAVRLVGRMLARMSARRPVVVRLDPPAPDALGMVERLAGTEVPALFVVVPADEVAADRILDLDDGVPIALGPLPEEDHLALLDALLPLDPALRDELAGASASSPEHAVQLVTELVIRNQLTVGPAGLARHEWRRDPLPADLEALWQERVRRVLAPLTAGERRQAQDALARGALDEVPPGLLGRMRRMRLKPERLAAALSP